MRYTSTGENATPRVSLVNRPVQPGHKPTITLPDTPLTVDSHTTYRATEDGCNVTVDCGYCGHPTAAWGVRTIVIGHLARVTVEPTTPDDDGLRWVPMTRKVNGCLMCALDYYDLCQHAMDAANINPRTGEPRTAYLDDGDSPVRKAEVATAKAARAKPSREVRAFYGDTFTTDASPTYEPEPAKVIRIATTCTLSDDWVETLKETKRKRLERERIGGYSSTGILK